MMSWQVHLGVLVPFTCLVGDNENPCRPDKKWNHDFLLTCLIRPAVQAFRGGCLFQGFAVQTTRAMLQSRSSGPYHWFFKEPAEQVHESRLQCSLHGTLCLSLKGSPGDQPTRSGCWRIQSFTNVQRRCGSISSNENGVLLQPSCCNDFGVLQHFPSLRCELVRLCGATTSTKRQPMADDMLHHHPVFSIPMWPPHAMGA